MSGIGRFKGAVRDEARLHHLGLGAVRERDMLKGERLGSRSRGSVLRGGPRVETSQASSLLGDARVDILGGKNVAGEQPNNWTGSSLLGRLALPHVSEPEKPVPARPNRGTSTAHRGGFAVGHPGEESPRPSRVEPYVVLGRRGGVGVFGTEVEGGPRASVIQRVPGGFGFALGDVAPDGSETVQVVSTGK